MLKAAKRNRVYGVLTVLFLFLVAGSASASISRTGDGSLAKSVCGPENCISENFFFRPDLRLENRLQVVELQREFSQIGLRFELGSPIDPDGRVGVEAGRTLYQDGLLAGVKYAGQGFENWGGQSSSGWFSGVSSFVGNTLSSVSGMGAPSSYVNGYVGAVENTSMVMENSMNRGNNGFVALGEGVTHQFNSFVGTEQLMSAGFGVDVARQEAISGNERWIRGTQGFAQLSSVGAGLTIGFKPTVSVDSSKITFWAGRQGVNRAAAESFAAANNQNTLAQTIEGIALDSSLDYTRMSVSEIRAAWTPLSERGAGSQSGVVHSYAGGAAPDSVWKTTELPRLLRNPNVEKIIILDATQPWKTVIKYPR